MDIIGKQNPSERPEETPTDESLTVGYEHPTSKSKDGYLVGGPHPELGDMVYNAAGDEVGKIKFFYDQLSVTSWRVQIDGVAEDPLVVVALAEPHEANPKKIAWWLCSLPGEAAKIPMTHEAVIVDISNQ